MLNFVAEHPTLLLCGFCVFTPGIIPVLLAYFIGKRGSPIKWIGFNSHESI